VVLFPLSQLDHRVPMHLSGAGISQLDSQLSLAARSTTRVTSPRCTCGEDAVPGLAGLLLPHPFRDVMASVSLVTLVAPRRGCNTPRLGGLADEPSVLPTRAGSATCDVRVAASAGTAPGHLGSPKGYDTHT
jgi:hypothetical protein